MSEEEKEQQAAASKVNFFGLSKLEQHVGVWASESRPQVIAFAAGLC